MTYNVEIKKLTDEVIQTSLDMDEDKIMILSTYMTDKRKVYYDKMAEATEKNREKSIIIGIDLNCKDSKQMRKIEHNGMKTEHQTIKQ